MKFQTLSDHIDRHEFHKSYLLTLQYHHKKNLKLYAEHMTAEKYKKIVDHIKNLKTLLIYIYRRIGEKYELQS